MSHKRLNIESTHKCNQCNYVLRNWLWQIIDFDVIDFDRIYTIFVKISFFFLSANNIIDCVKVYAKVNEPFPAENNNNRIPPPYVPDKFITDAYISAVIKEPTYFGEWKYKNRDYRLFDGDMVYFWLNVITLDRQQHVKRQMCVNITSTEDGLIGVSTNTRRPIPV